MATHSESVRLVRSYLPHSLALTFAVIVVPLIAVMGLLAALTPDPPLLLTGIVALVVATLVNAAGSALWMRSEHAREFSFGELMLWGWIRRKHAEERVARDAHLLGLESDRTAPYIPLDREAHLDLLHDLSAALETKDPYTHGHSARVQDHVFRTGKEMGLAEPDLEDLCTAAGLHDVGKIRIPNHILRKPADLTDRERAIIQSHAILGAAMVARVANEHVVRAIRHHHERWDGAGYPNGLRGAEIPLLARVIAVADAYDAMTSTRPYRIGLSHQEAIDALRADAGVQFDPGVVDAFVASAREPVRLGGFLLLPLISGRLFRQVAAWARRAGAGSLAPAAGAAGAAVVLSASIMAPAVSPVTTPKSAAPAVRDVERGAEFEYVAALDSARFRDATKDASESPLNKKPDKATDRRDRGARGSANDEGGPASSAGDGFARAGNGPGAGPGGHAGGEDPGTGLRSGGDDPGPDGDGPGNDAGAGTGGNTEPPNPPPDPQPDRGRDCEEHGNSGSQGEGKEFHCD